LLPRAQFVSSVSGGSIANGVLACQWDQLVKDQFAPGAVEQHVVEPIVESISRSSLKAELLLNLWRAAGRQTRTNVFARVLDCRFLRGCGRG
jgi:NTE family protein